VDAFETLATSFGGGGALVGDADGDGNRAELNGTNVPFDILRLVTIGQQDSRAPEGHQVGTLDRSLGIGIDTAKDGASLDDGSSLGGNYGDEGAPGTNHLQNGEFVRFDLGADFEGVSARIVFSASGLITRDGEDAVVRLLDSTGALVDQFAIDLDGGLTHVVSGATVFDQVEIEALAGTQLAVADVDIDVVADLSVIAPAIGDHLIVGTIRGTPSTNGNDRFAAWRDTDENGLWDSGETREDLAVFGNGTAMTALADGGSLVDLSFSAPGTAQISGNQDQVAVRTNGGNNGAQVTAGEAIAYTLETDDALAAKIQLVNAEALNSSNPGSIPAGTDITVELLQGSTVIETITVETGAAAASIDLFVSDDLGATFDGLRLGIATGGSGSFAVNDVVFFV
jgi:hypothetical protein